MSHRLQSGFPGIATVLALVFTLALPLSLSAQDPGQTGEAFTISGVVRDAADNTLLQYTVVGIPELGAWAISEANGSYSLDVAGPGTFRLVVLKRGWYMANQDVTFAGPDGLDITLYKEQSDAPLGPGRLVGRVLEGGSEDPIRNATVRYSPPRTRGSKNHPPTTPKNTKITIRALDLGVNHRGGIVGLAPGPTPSAAADSLMAGVAKNPPRPRSKVQLTTAVTGIPRITRTTRARSVQFGRPRTGTTMSAASRIAKAEAR